MGERKMNPYVKEWLGWVHHYAVVYRRSLSEEELNRLWTLAGKPNLRGHDLDQGRVEWLLQLAHENTIPVGSSHMSMCIQHERADMYRDFLRSRGYSEDEVDFLR